MAQFDTFDLGRVIANAEAIKGMRQRSITEKLQQQFLRQMMQAGEQEMVIRAQQAQAAQQQAELRKGFAEISNILNSPDPISAARSNPMLQNAFRQAGGDPASVPDELLIQNLRNRQRELASELGEIIPTATPLSSQGKLVADQRAGFLTPEQVAASQQPESVRKLRALQDDPSLLAMETSLRRASSPQVSVNTRQEAEESKAIGRELGQQYASIQKAGVDANFKISRYERMSQLLDGVKTGKLTPKLTEVAALADALGIKLDPNIGEKQALQALSNEIALGLRNPSGGAGMPGALSDRDREFLVSMTPGLGNTPEGNKLIIQSALKLAKRDQDVAKMARTYRAKHGTLEGFAEELAQWSAEHPLFESESAIADASGAADFIYVPGQGLQPGR